MVAQKLTKAIGDIQKKLQGLQQYVWLTNEDLKWETVNLSNLVELAGKQAEQENEGINIVIKAEAIPVIEANREQMEFLLKELLLNAVKFRKPGNEVKIKIYAGTLLLNKFRQLSGKYKYAEFLKLQIEDDGIGFDDQYQEQAFELFRVLYPNTGLGVGLALCRKIVENHNGFISLEGIKDVRTSVIIYLPLTLNATRSVNAEI